MLNMSQTAKYDALRNCRVFPKNEPNKIASPWLKNEPKATPSKIVKVLSLVEKDNTKICVLSPNSESEINKNDIIRGYKLFMICLQ